MEERALVGGYVFMYVALRCRVVTGVLMPHPVNVIVSQIVRLSFVKRKKC